MAKSIAQALAEKRQKSGRPTLHGGPNLPKKSAFGNGINGHAPGYAQLQDAKKMLKKP